jgi:hypothetical protein
MKGICMLLHLLIFVPVLAVLFAIALGITLWCSNIMPSPDGTAIGAAAGTVMMMGGSIAYFMLFPLI